jgi:26S proteasome regulatory subunit N10
MISLTDAVFDDAHRLATQAEADAVNLLAGAKTQSNPENAVGVLSLAGKVPRVLVTPTQDLGAVLNSVHGIRIEGEVNICVGVQVAHLALKHRQNKHQRMRIVLFIGSPIRVEERELVAVGKKLRKCNVAVDVVSFGDIEANEAKLAAFMSAVNKNNNSNLVTVEPGANLSDVLCGTAIFNQDGPAGGSGFAAAAAAAQSQAAMQGFGGDMGDMGDMGDDPALMMALRISLEEERARQEAQQRAEAERPADAAADAAADAPVAATEGAGSADTSPAPADPMMLDDDALLRQALALSVGEDAEDDPDLAAALAMSMADHRDAAANDDDDDA